MICPTCGTAGAYVGFTSVECLNTDCSNFSDAWYQEWLSQQANEIDRALDMFNERPADTDRITLPMPPDWLDP